MSINIYGLILLICFCYASSDLPVVETPLGTIRGSIKQSYHGRDFAAFEGIPFAKPPIGNRRFEAPEPVEAWKGIWDAKFLLGCAQTDMTQPTKIVGQEDCLYINVYVPSSNPKPGKNLEVIVHIHGGAFMYGSGHFYSKPELIMDRDVIFVTFNYRLGILGFLSTEDEALPGNNGLKDQTLALKWVQNNIASFGGNPDSVTLTGLSAGGASVHLHYFSELSKNLFHRGFSQSGVAFNPWVIQEAASEKTKILASAVGCPIYDSRLLVDCLKERPHEQLLSKMSLFFSLGSMPLAPFAPVVETGKNAFLKEHPYQLLKKGDVLDVPWVLSNTAHEGYVPQLFEMQEEDYFDKNWLDVAPILLDFNYTLDKSLWTNAADKIRDFYFGDSKISSENIDLLSQLFGDRTFYVDAENAVRLQAKVAKSPVYFFRFAYPGDGAEIKYVSHGADARYYFGPIFVSMPLTENDEKMKDILLDMLVSYAKTSTPEIKGVSWGPTGSNQLTYLNIKSYEAEDINVRTTDELSPIEFWKSLGLRENDNLVSIKDEL